jgi:hypothetical protein
MTATSGAGRRGNDEGTTPTGDVGMLHRLPATNRDAAA